VRVIGSKGRKTSRTNQEKAPHSQKPEHGAPATRKVESQLGPPAHPPVVFERMMFHPPEVIEVGFGVAFFARSIPLLIPGELFAGPVDQPIGGLALAC
jgi:hypothetical protein